MLELLYKSFGKGQSTQDPEILKMLIKAQLAAELETQKANIGKTPAPPAPAGQVIVTHAGLCTGVEITPADEGKNWAIVWRAEGDQFALLIDRSSVARLTIGLIQQARAREWNFPPHIGDGLV